MDKITVIVPHYGHKQYLMDAVQSILNQTFINFELFILNDDVESLKSYELLDDRIKVFDRIGDNKLSSEIRVNKILPLCSKYILYQEADAISFPNRIDISLKYLKNKKVDIICCHCINMSFAKSVVYAKGFKGKRYSGISTTLMKKSVLTAIKLNEKITYGSDIDWWHRIERSQFKYYLIDLPLLKRYTDTSSVRKYCKIPIIGKLHRYYLNLLFKLRS